MHTCDCLCGCPDLDDWNDESEECRFCCESICKDCRLLLQNDVVCCKVCYNIIINKKKDFFIDSRDSENCIMCCSWDPDAPKCDEFIIFDFGNINKEYNTFTLCKTCYIMITKQHI
jgi:serine/threonine-protein kinase RIO1